jgi:signal transduction histidine kinase
MGQRYGLRVAFKDDEAAKPLNETQAAILFRAARELLMNVHKHAQSSTATMTLERVGSVLQLIVEDTGLGFDPSAVHPGSNRGGFGLFSLREQIKQLGGTFEVSSRAGRGTRAQVRVPLVISEVPLQQIGGSVAADAAGSR